MSRLPGRAPRDDPGRAQRADDDDRDAESRRRPAEPASPSAPATPRGGCVADRERYLSVVQSGHESVPCGRWSRPRQQSAKSGECASDQERDPASGAPPPVGGGPGAHVGRRRRDLGRLPRLGVGREGHRERDRVEEVADRRAPGAGRDGSEREPCARLAGRHDEVVPVGAPVGGAVGQVGRV